MGWLLGETDAGEGEDLLAGGGESEAAVEDVTRELLCVAGSGGGWSSSRRRNLVVRVWLRSREWEERRREGGRRGTSRTEGEVERRKETH